MHAALAPADPAVFLNHSGVCFAGIVWHLRFVSYTQWFVSLGLNRYGIVDMFSVVISILVFIDFVWFAILFYQ